MVSAPPGEARREDVGSASEYKVVDSAKKSMVYSRLRREVEECEEKVKYRGGKCRVEEERRRERISPEETRKVPTDGANHPSVYVPVVLVRER